MKGSIRISGVSGTARRHCLPPGSASAAASSRQITAYPSVRSGHPRDPDASQEVPLRKMCKINALHRKLCNRGKSEGTQVPHALNANDQMDAGNENIGAGAGQAGRSRALT